VTKQQNHLVLTTPRKAAYHKDVRMIETITPTGFFGPMVQYAAQLIQLTSIIHLRNTIPIILAGSR